ncbi:MAG: cysteine-rich small domain-containing protein [Thermoflexaceae bacterium]|nr:cysteine-rich small domain-containing protein [Thermoflexaceae bacterium]
MDNYKFYQNKSCEYFPCHKLENPQEFNCLFCYCPLYGLGDRCGGDYVYLENGIKSCVNCVKPHDARGYEHVKRHMKEVIELARKK